jgi:hypothetical protein
MAAQINYTAFLSLDQKLAIKNHILRLKSQPDLCRSMDVKKWRDSIDIEKVMKWVDIFCCGDSMQGTVTFESNRCIFTIINKRHTPISPTNYIVFNNHDTFMVVEDRTELAKKHGYIVDN